MKIAAAFKRFPRFRLRYPKGHFWSTGKGGRTVGDVDQETVIDYVRRQAEQTSIIDFIKRNTGYHRLQAGEEVIFFSIAIASRIAGNSALKPRYLSFRMLFLRLPCRRRSSVPFQSCYSNHPPLSLYWSLCRTLSSSPDFCFPRSTPRQPGF